MRTRLLALLVVPAIALSLVACSKAKPIQAPAPPAAANPAAPAPSATVPVTGQPVTPAPVQPAPVPAPAPATPGTASSLKAEVPFQDVGKVWAAINAPSSIRYRVVNLAAPAGTDKTKHLDEFLAKEGAPGPNDLVLLVFPADRSDIRFAMGSVFFQKGVKVEELLGLIRTRYLPLASQGKPEDGLAALVQAVNDRMK